MPRNLFINPIKESYTDLGLLTIVAEDKGKCGCGKCDMTNVIAYFKDEEEAKLYVERMK